MSAGPRQGRSHFAEIPVDDGARDGRFHGLRASDGTFHSGCWSSDIGQFVYSNGVPIQRVIVAYNARLPGNPST